MTIVVALWAISYWRTLIVGRADATWSPSNLTVRRTAVVFTRGRLELLFVHWQDFKDTFLPEKWAQISPEGQQRILDYRSRNPAFHGWQFGAPMASLPPTGTVIYESLLGLERQRVYPGDGFAIYIPAWILAALLAIPGARWLHVTCVKTRRGFPVELDASPDAV